MLLLLLLLLLLVVFGGCSQRLHRDGALLLLLLFSSSRCRPWLPARNAPASTTIKESGARTQGVAIRREVAVVLWALLGANMDADEEGDPTEEEWSVTTAMRTELGSVAVCMCRARSETRAQDRGTSGS